MGWGGDTGEEGWGFLIFDLEHLHPSPESGVHMWESPGRPWGQEAAGVKHLILRNIFRIKHFQIN